MTELQAAELLTVLIPALVVFTLTCGIAAALMLIQAYRWGVHDH